MAKWIIESANQEPQEEGFLGRAKRVGISAGTKAAESIEGLASIFNPVEYVPGFGGKQNRPSVHLKEKYGLTPEYLEPQGAVESGIHRFAQGAPLAIGLGSSLAPLAAGSAAAAGANALGAPEIAQDVVQLGTELWMGKKPSLMKSKAAADIALRSSVHPMEKYNFKNTPAALAEVTQGLEQAGEKIQSSVQAALKPVKMNLSRAMGNPLKLLDARKWLNHEMYKWDAPMRLSFGKPIADAITKDLIEYGIENPTFINNLTKRDQLTMAKYMATPLSDFLTKAPFVEKVLSPKMTSFLKTPERIVKSILKFPEARSLYGDMALSAIENNPDRFIKSVDLLKDYIPGLDTEKQYHSPNNSNRWIIESASKP